MAERIRRIIMGSDLVMQGEVKRDTATGEQTGYPVILPDGAYGAYRVTLTLFLSAFVKARQLGRVFGDGVTFNLDKPGAGGVMDPTAPEISFVSFERLPADAYEDVTLQLSPDLVVEGAPPTLSIEAALYKVTYYLDHGISQVWLIFPAAREIRAFTSENRDGTTLAIDDDLTGEGLLAGFSVPLHAIFDDSSALQVEVLKKLMGS